MTETLTRRTLKGAAWLGGASIARLGLRLISVGILARLLTPHEYGITAAALVVMEFAFVLYSLGLAPALIQRREVRDEHVATAFSASLGMAAIAGIGMWSAAPLAANLMGIPELRDVLKVLAFTAPFGAFSALCEALLARSMRTKSIALRPLFTFIFANFFVAIPLAYYGCGYWSLIAMHIAEVLVGTAVFAFAARDLLVRPGLSRPAFRELWPMSLGFSITEPALYFGANIDSFLIARLLGADALGLYSRASFVSKNALNLFGTIARVAAFPAMAKIQTEQDRLQRAVLKILLTIAIITMPASAFSFIFAGEIVDLLLGHQWISATASFAFLSSALYFYLSRRACYAVFQALGRPSWITLAQVLYAGTLVPAIWWSSSYGLTVCSAAVVVVLFLSQAGNVFLLRRAIGLTLKQFMEVHLFPVLLTVFVASAAWGIKASFAGLPSHILLVFAALLLAFPILLLLRVRPSWILGASGAAMLRGA